MKKSFWSEVDDAAGYITATWIILGFIGIILYGIYKLLVLAVAYPEWVLTTILLVLVFVWPYIVAAIWVSMKRFWRWALS